MNQMIKHNLRIAQVYRPRPYPGKIIFYAATQDRGYHGWCHLAKDGVAVIQVSGTHVSIMDEPNVLVLARQLENVLDQVSEKYRSKQNVSSLNA